MLRKETNNGECHLRVITKDGQERLLPQWMFESHSFDPSPVEHPVISFTALLDLHLLVSSTARRKHTASGERVHSFRTLLDDLATVTNNRVVAPLADAKPFDLITRPTALQRKAFKLLGVRLERTQ